MLFAGTLDFSLVEDIDTPVLCPGNKRTGIPEIRPSRARMPQREGLVRMQAGTYSMYYFQHWSSDRLKTGKLGRDDQYNIGCEEAFSLATNGVQPPVVMQMARG